MAEVRRRKAENESGDDGAGAEKRNSSAADSSDHVSTHK